MSWERESRVGGGAEPPSSPANTPRAGPEAGKGLRGSTVCAHPILRVSPGFLEGHPEAHGPSPTSTRWPTGLQRGPRRCGPPVKRFPPSFPPPQLIPGKGLDAGAGMPSRLPYASRLQPRGRGKPFASRGLLSLPGAFSSPAVAWLHRQPPFQPPPAVSCPGDVPTPS